MTKKKAFVVPCTIFFLTWYFGFVILAGYAPDFMGEEFLVDGLTVGYMLALSQFVMTWGLAAWYLRRSDRVFDPLAKRAADKALEVDGAGNGRLGSADAPSSAGLIFLFGFDGFLYSVGFLVAFLTVLFLLGERMRNSGKYAIADVLSFRMNERPARSAAALGTLSVAGFST